MGDPTPKIAAAIVLILLVLPLAVHGGDVSSKYTNRVTISEIRANITKDKPVVCDRAEIQGNLSLNNLGLCTTVAERSLFEKESNISTEVKIVRSLIKITNSKINGSVDFGNTVFENSTNFDGTQFNGTALFNGSKFCKPANFQSSTFNRSADFKSSNFTRYADFESATFNRSADFSLSNFDGPANFMSSTFNGSADFPLSNFNGDAYFSLSNFTKGVDFSTSKFKGDAFFLNSSFKNITNIDDMEYNKLYINFYKIDKLAYDETAYQLLIDNFKKIGFMSDADDCYYQFRVGQFLHQKPIEDLPSFIFNFGALIFYGFGKEPLYPVLWSAFFIVFFGFMWKGMSPNEPNTAIRRKSIVWSIVGSTIWVLFFMLIEAYYLKDIVHNIGALLLSLLILLMFFVAPLAFFWRVTKLKKSEGALNEHAVTQNLPMGMSEALSFSATVFLSGTKLFVDPPEIPIPILQDRAGSFVKKVFGMERLLGAFFSILLVLALQSTLVR